MLWNVGAVCMILFGGGIGVIGLSLGMLGYVMRVGWWVLMAYSCLCPLVGGTTLLEGKADLSEARSAGPS